MYTTNFHYLRKAKYLCFNVAEGPDAHYALMETWRGKCIPLLTCMEMLLLNSPASCSFMPMQITCAVTEVLDPGGPGQFAGSDFPGKEIWVSISIKIQL